jgi:antitoxin (DNA-binding transcriptional repressor) of toxin-antitoxin stability system
MLVLRPEMYYIMIRKAARGHTIDVTDCGNPVAALTPYHPEAAAAQFECRETLPAFDALPQIDAESAKYISEDRDSG